MSERLEKRCSTCEIVKSLDEFSRQLGGKFGRRSQCKACRKALDGAYVQANSEEVKAYQSAYRSARRLANHEEVRAQERERDKHRDKRRRSDPEYRERQAEYGKMRYAQNPEKYRESRLKRYYNLTGQEYQQMYQAQGGLCAICGNPQISGRQLAVDHDHESGLVRGLLCQSCNRGIGYFGDDVSRLESAVGYLRGHQPSTDVS